MTFICNILCDLEIFYRQTQTTHLTEKAIVLQTNFWLTHFYSRHQNLTNFHPTSILPRLICVSSPNRNAKSPVMVQTILIFQSAEHPRLRSSREFNSLTECLEFVCEVYERYISRQNDNAKIVSYTIDHLFAFLDKVKSTQFSPRYAHP